MKKLFFGTIAIIGLVYVAIGLHMIHPGLAVVGGGALMLTIGLVVLLDE